MQRILCVSSKLHPGVSKVFNNFINVVDNSKHIFVENITSDHDFDNFDLIIFGAWHPLYLPMFQNITCKKSVLWTSSPLQMELSPDSVEINFFNELCSLLDKRIIDYIFIGDKKFSKIFSNKKIKQFYYPIHLERYIENPMKWGKPETNFGLFTVNHPRKNRFNQINAFILASNQNPKLKLYTNVLKKEHHNIINLDWLPNNDFEKQIERIHFGLNVFPSESFCYSFIDFMSKGIPTICSETIANNFDISSYGMISLNELIVYDCDDCVEIKNSIINLSEKSKLEKEELSLICRNFVEEFAMENNKKLRNFITQLT